MQTHEAEPKASPKQKVRKALVRLGLRPYYYDIAIKAELEDEKFKIDDEPSPTALADLLKRIGDAPTPSDRYRLLLEPVPYPQGVDTHDKAELWFDYIDGLTSRDIVGGIVKTAAELLPEGRGTWERAVDLGAGIGYLGATLIGKNDLPKVADSVDLVDMLPTLLQVAQNRYGAGVGTVAADVTELPFADDTFDLAASTGLVYALEPEQQELYFREISRVLRPGGIYLDGNYCGGRIYSKSRSVARFQLERLIQMQTALQSPLDPLQDIEDKVAFFERLGLKLSYKDYKDEVAQTDIQIRILQKNQK
jgi:SAM-dependent methyltransferase